MGGGEGEEERSERGKRRSQAMGHRHIRNNHQLNTSIIALRLISIYDLATISLLKFTS
jgi:hypothetical protein